MKGLLEIIVPIVTAIITGILGPIIAYYFRKRNRVESEENEEENQDEYSKSKYLIEKRREEIDENIKNKLENIREEINADRSWIIQFQDGKEQDESIHNLKKFSMVYEDAAQGVSKEKKNFEDLLVSFFIDTVDRIVQEKELIYDTVKDAENSEIVRIFDQKGNSSMYLFAMETIDNILIGILGVDFVREEHKITEKEKQFLRKQAYSLAGYLYNREVD